MKVEIVVTHLLGTGHLARAVTLAQAFQEAGHDVCVVSGGMPVARFDASDVPLKQLAPLRSDGVDFTRLLDANGALADTGYLQDRTETLLSITKSFQPDVLITELFPFGRRILRAEFAALLNAVREMGQPPMVFSSIRDILAPPSKPKKVVFADNIIATFYDGVLVHADPAITPLEQSWPVSEALAAKLHYTGFVAPAPAPLHPQMAGQDEILVSAGGGDVGARLFATARAAAKLASTRQWRLLIGGHDAADQIAALRADAPENLTVEATRPDFRQMLHHVAASVSFCGYNTAQDVLQTGCPAVFVPFDEGNEVEQGIRADALASLPGIEVLRMADLTAEALLGAISHALSAPKRAVENAADGATRTVEIVEEQLGERKA